MARGPGIAAVVVCALAGHAYAQPGAQPPQPQPQPQQPQPPQPPPPPDEAKQNAICFSGRPHECASVLLLELGVRGTPVGAVTTGDVGLLIHNGLDAYGATIGFVAPDDPDAAHGASLLYAGRYRRYLGTWGLAGDVSVGYAEGPALELALGWGDVIALTAGINAYEIEGGGHNVVAGAGVRVGAVAIGGVLYVTALVFTSGR